MPAAICDTLTPKFGNFIFTDCPACYNLVQDAVNVHRLKLTELSDLLDDINKNPSIIDDKEFEVKLREVMAEVDKLLDDAKKATGLYS